MIPDLNPRGNLADLPQEHRDWIEAHRIYCFMRHHIRTGRLTVRQAETKLKSVTEPHRSMINEIRGRK